MVHGPRRRPGRPDHAQAPLCHRLGGLHRARLRPHPAFAELLGGGRVADRHGHRGRSDRARRHGHYARHVPSGGLQHPERAQSGLQSCGKHDRRRPVWAARLEVRPARRVRARRRLRPAFHRVGPAGSAPFDRRPRRPRPVGGWQDWQDWQDWRDWRDGRGESPGTPGAAAVQAASDPGRLPGPVPPRQRRPAAPLRLGGEQGGSGQSVGPDRPDHRRRPGAS